jgi:molybdopterin molybdotransferase
MREPGPIDPVRALRALAARIHPEEAVEYALDEAPPGYLAEAVPAAAPAGPAGERRALWNGFALPPGLARGDECAVLGTIAVDRVLDAFGRPPPAGRGPPAVEGRSVWRVETGAPVPAGAVSVLPVAGATLVGPDRIRIGDLPAAGDGLAPAGVERCAVPAGFPLDARLRAFLAGSGVRSVRVRPPFEVGIACVGDEIVDLHDAQTPGGRPDLVAPWIESALERIGLIPTPLGILGDEPEALRRALLHVMDRKVDVVILAGGLGEGVTDRLLEALSRFDAHVSMAGVDADGLRGLALSRAARIDIIAIGGRPLEAAAAFDLLVRPALLARRGAAARLWDWTRARFPLEPSTAASLKRSAAGSWLVRPAVLDPAPDGGARVRAWEPSAPFLPLAPPQEGWAVIPPERDGAHFGEM